MGPGSASPCPGARHRLLQGRGVAVYRHGDALPVRRRDCLLQRLRVGLHIHIDLVGLRVEPLFKEDPVGRRVVLHPFQSLGYRDRRKVVAPFQILHDLPDAGLKAGVYVVAAHVAGKLGGDPRFHGALHALPGGLCHAVLGLQRRLLGSCVRRCVPRPVGLPILQSLGLGVYLPRIQIC